MRTKAFRLPLIPLLSLRGAWKADRAIVLIDEKLADHLRKNPIVDS